MGLVEKKGGTRMIVRGYCHSRDYLAPLKAMGLADKTIWLEDRGAETLNWCLASFRARPGRLIVAPDLRVFGHAKRDIAAVMSRLERAPPRSDGRSDRPEVFSPEDQTQHRVRAHQRADAGESETVKEPEMDMDDNPLQRMVNVMNALGRNDRSRYHLTLGQLIEKLEGVNSGWSVKFSSGKAPGDADSYRGYYSDLSFEPTDRDVLVGDLLDRAKNALGRTFTGYKGGDFLMEAETPLWTAPYGSCGLAIVGFETDGVNTVTLLTKDLD
jgi:hypothetical protein